MRKTPAKPHPRLSNRIAYSLSQKTCCLVAKGIEGTHNCVAPSSTNSNLRVTAEKGDC